MVSSPDLRRSRRDPAERRREIVEHAAAIALAEGLERITVRAVAESVGVQPGLISHYFPAAHDLVVAAFEHAAAGEREDMFPGGSTALGQVAALVAFIGSDAAVPLSRLWLNARHLSRFSPDLAACVHAQESVDSTRLVEIVSQGVAAGEFAADDAEVAAVRILMAVDAYGTYANEDTALAGAAFRGFVADCAEWSLGLAPGTLA